MVPTSVKHAENLDFNGLFMVVSCFFPAFGKSCQIDGRFADSKKVHAESHVPSVPSVPSPIGHHPSPINSFCFSPSNPHLVDGLEHFYHFFIPFHILGMEKSSQLTFSPSFFRGVGRLKPPTRLLLAFINHMPYNIHILTIIIHIMLGWNHQPAIYVTHIPSVTRWVTHVSELNFHGKWARKISNSLICVAKNQI